MKYPSVRSYSRGIARVIDLYGNLSFKPREKSDAELLFEDWIRIGKDISNAVRSYGKFR